MAGMKIKKGDRVQVLTGKDRGKQGVVMRSLPEVRKVVVDGVNVAKRHTRSTRATQQAGIIDKDMPIPVANVAVVDPNCGKPTRVGYRFEETAAGRRKVRVCKKCGADLT